MRLEPLSLSHLDGLVAASSSSSAADPALYRWSAVPIGREEVLCYIETALAWRDAGKAHAFAIVRNADGAVLGSTRFFDMESWAWPAGHPRHGREHPDVCEIGYTWLTPSAIRTARTLRPSCSCLRTLSRSGACSHLPAHRCAKQTLPGGHRTHRREIRRSFPRAPHGCGLYAARLISLLDRRQRVAGDEAAAQGPIAAGVMQCCGCRALSCRDKFSRVPNSNVRLNQTGAEASFVFARSRAASGAWRCR